MRIVFIGVGEAFDESLPNTSLLVHTPGQPGLVLDCGFTAAAALFRHAPGVTPGAVYVSHFHGDHFLGLPFLLMRLWEEGRREELLLVGQAGLRDKVEAALELAYPGFSGRLGYPVAYLEARAGESQPVLGFELGFARTTHPSSCLAVRVRGAGASLLYSGDGGPTPEVFELARGADVIVQEAYSLAPVAGHATLDAALSLARDAGARRLALVHVARGVRGERREELTRRLAEVRDLEAFLPEPGQVLEL